MDPVEELEEYELHVRRMKDIASRTRFRGYGRVISCQWCGSLDLSVCEQKPANEPDASVDTLWHECPDCNSGDADVCALMEEPKDCDCKASGFMETEQGDIYPCPFHPAPFEPCGPLPAAGRPDDETAHFRCEL